LSAILQPARPTTAAGVPNRCLLLRLVGLTGAGPPERAVASAWIRRGAVWRRAGLTPRLRQLFGCARVVPPDPMSAIGDPAYSSALAVASSPPGCRVTKI
jgi:hypothetical protein